MSEWRLSERGTPGRRISDTYTSVGLVNAKTSASFNMGKVGLLTLAELLPHVPLNEPLQ